MLKVKILSILLLLGMLAHAQFNLNGKVTDENGKPLTGASLQFKGLRLGTITNANGEYVFKNIEKGEYTLMASYLGYNKVEKQFTITKNMVLDFSLESTSVFTEEVIVASTRAHENTPVTYSVVDKKTIESKNIGQDMPYMMSMEPSLVTTSDAGAGVGYTGLWIRGSNIQRINVTVNGIPLNDPESHGVFWVNMPDFSSSVNSAQIQRGVGTSTNGGGAFGASINLETNHVEKDAFAEINNSVGSFNTLKNNVRFGTGLIKNKWAFEGRLSRISSDGYVDRASSDLKSYFVQGGYYTENTTIKAVVFGGKEKTYQSWNGVSQDQMDKFGRTYNSVGAIFGKYPDGSTAMWDYDYVDSFYDNEVDNYQQDHYQLHLSQKITDNLKFNGALHYTYGRGYYEQYKQESSFADFGLTNHYFAQDSSETFAGSGIYNYFYQDSITSSDLIVRRWLDNHFYGTTFAFDYTLGNLKVNLGGAINKYADGKHFGEIIWAQHAGNSNIRNLYYENVSNKSDFNNYLKVNYKLGALNLFTDLQYRIINYTAEGKDKDGVIIDIDETYNFFNPKFGFTYNIQSMGDIYGSFAIANREPIRTDFLDAPNGIKPEPEKLSDFELGIRKRNSKYFYNANGYFMKYSNQLVLTGELNDVGSPIRKNVGESTRLGIELDGGWQPIKKIAFRANLALSSSNTDFKEESYDENWNTVIVDHTDVQITFSPQTIAGAEINFYPVKNAEIALMGKYVSKQYLDLTNSEDKMLDAYSFANLRLGYSLYPKTMEEIKLTVMVNNLFNQMYSTNGYVYWGTPYYYPQAGINFLAGISLKF